MKWFKRKLYSWIQEIGNEPLRPYPESNIKTHSGKLTGYKSSDADVWSEGMRFRLTSAIGGRILTVTQYNLHQDRDDIQTYVIPQGEDVGARVAKILNLELLK